MFRRTKSEASPVIEPATPEGKPGGKGRPTRSRKEAEAARKASFKKPKNRREAAALRREKIRIERAKMQDAMRTGDDRYLPQPDKGPVRRYARDYVDTRWSVTEFALPVLLVVSLAGVLLGRVFAWLPATVNLFFMVMILAIALDCFVLTRGLRRAVTQKYPNEPTRGLGFYAIRRTMQMRRWRLPKPMVTRGEKLG